MAQSMELLTKEMQGIKTEDDILLGNKRFIYWIKIFKYWTKVFK